MTKSCKQRQVERSALLTKQFFEYSTRRLIFQDEKDFPLQIPIVKITVQIFLCLKMILILIVCFMMS